MLNIIAGTLSVGVTPSTNSYESIATVTVGSTPQATITFSSIPATYTHLQLRALSKSSRNDPGEYQNTMMMRFNSDSSSAYSDHRLLGSGSSALAGSNTSNNNMSFYFGTAASTPSNTFAVAIWDILDYANTNKYKTVRCLSGIENNTDGVVCLGSGSWRNTNAVSTITIDLVGSFNHTQYSSFALYGIKGV